MHFRLNLKWLAQGTPVLPCSKGYHHSCSQQELNIPGAFLELSVFCDITWDFFFPLYKYICSSRGMDVVKFKQSKFCWHLIPSRIINKQTPIRWVYHNLFFLRFHQNSKICKYLQTVLERWKITGEIWSQWAQRENSCWLPWLRSFIIFVLWEIRHSTNKWDTSMCSHIWNLRQVSEFTWLDSPVNAPPGRVHVET